MSTVLLMAATRRGGLDLPAWITALATSVLALGVLQSARQIREARMARLTEAAAGVSRRWDGDELMAARRAIDRFESDLALRDAVISLMAPGGDPTDELDLLLREPNFFEDLGAQELLGGLTLKWIELSMQGIVQDRWCLWHATVLALRSADDRRPPIYDNFETLARRLDGEMTRWHRRKRQIALSLLRAVKY